MVKVLEYLKSSPKKIFYVLAGLIILLGIYLRAKTYFLFSPTWCDEVFLINNIIFKSFLSLFFPLESLQAAPPLFLVLIKFIAKIIGADYELFALRLLPFLFSCFSVILFFCFLLKSIKNKIVILAGLLLFSINSMLIYYSAEVKQYSCDIFFCILFLYLYDKFNIQNKKQLLITLFIAYIAPFLSFTSIFVMLAMVLYKFFEVKEPIRNKIPYLYTLITIFVSSGFLWLILNVNNQDMFAFFNARISEFSLSNFFFMVSAYLKYLNLYSIVTMALLFIGMLVSFIKKNKYGIIMTIVFFEACVLSFMGKYPFEGRAILYLMPVCLYFMLCACSTIETKKNILNNVISILLLFIMFYSVNNIFDTFPTGSHSPNHQERMKDKEVVTNFLSKYNEDDKLIVTRFLVQFIKYYNVESKFNKNITYKDFISESTLDDVNKLIKTEDKKGNIWILGFKDNPCAFDGEELENYLKSHNYNFEKNNIFYEYLFYIKR